MLTHITWIGRISIKAIQEGKSRLLLGERGGVLIPISKGIISVKIEFQLVPQTLSDAFRKHRKHVLANNGF